MFTYLIKVTICWLGFYLIYSAFLKKETFFHINRWYLLATLLLGAGIPLLEFLPVFQEDAVAVVYLQPLNESVYYVQAAVNEAVTQSSFGWVQLFWSVYLLGVTVLGVRFFMGLGKIWKLYSGAKILQKENHTLVITKELHLPFSFFKLLFWSKDFEMNEVDGQKIVTHEEAHVKGWHSVDVLLCEIMSIIFWCSPMVYFYKKSLKTVHEYLADAVVLQTTPTKKYGHLLLKQSQSGLQVALANHFFHSQLKQRIIMMTKSKSRKQAIIKYLFALPVILLLVILFSKKEAIANTETEPVKIVQEESFDDLSSITDIEKHLESDVDEMPLFPGCEDVADKKEQRLCSDNKMLTFIYTNIKYPKAAAKAGIEGKVIIKFLVKKDGSIANARIAKDIGGGCGAQALKVIQGLPKMIAGRKDGKAVDTEMVIPVSFKLADDNEMSSIEKLPLEEYLTDEKAHFTINDKQATRAEVKKLKPEEIGSYDIAKVEKKKEGVMYSSFDVVMIKTKNFLPDGNQSSLRFGKLDPNENNLFHLDGKRISESIAYALPSDDIANINIRRVTMTDNQEVVNHIMIISKEEVGDKNNKSIASIVPDESVFNIVDEMPRFAGCEEQTADKSFRKLCAEKKMMHYIYSNIKYPKAAKDAAIQGRVIAQFVVKKDGSIADIKILRGIGGGCDEATQSVLKSMPKWIAGKQDGKNVNVKFTMPILFKLNDDSKGVSVEKMMEKFSAKKLKPLIVVDGEIRTEENANSIQPSEIAMVNVLKGEKAMEKYGNAGKNGVIEIQLKKAKTTEESPNAKTRTHPVEKKNALKTAGLTYVKVSPNPTNGKIDIEYGSQDKPMTISITDVNGKEIFRKEVTGGRSSLRDVNVKNAAKGLLLVTFQQDGKTYTEKVILQ